MKKISRRNFVPLMGTAILGASGLSLNTWSERSTEHEIRIPQRLVKGSTVGICVPAGPIRENKEVHEFKHLLESMGYQVKIGMNAYGKYGYFSANDTDRATEFMQLIEDEAVDAIFFIRGGWGCARILEMLDFESIQKHPKIIMGFSDITTLLNAISSRTGIVTFHGPGGNSTWNEYSLNYINRLLVHGEMVEYINLPAVDSRITTYSSGIARGQLYGGNLSVLSGLIGSEFLPDWRGKILFLEDVKEEPYRIDRMLTQMKLAGIFNRVEGVVLGNFRKCEAEEPHRSFTLEEVFDQHFKDCGIPVFYGAQIGHIRNKFTVPVGLPVEMNADKGMIRLLQSAVH